MLNFAIIPEGLFVFDSALPRREFGSDNQRVDSETGLPQWSVSVLHRGKDDRRSELMTITVPCAKNPAETLEPFTPVEFDGLRFMSGENNGRVWVSLSARSVAPRGAKSQPSKQ